MSSREKILQKLRDAQQPFTDIPPIEERKRVTVQVDTSQEALRQRFIEEAIKLGAFIIPVADDEEGIEAILKLVGDDRVIRSWDFEHIPIVNLKNALVETNIEVTDDRHVSARAGITGVDIALAATGSLVLQSGDGKSRGASLLPEVHIAVIRENQILQDLEAWAATEKNRWAQPSNTTIISGASRTADIGMELVMGAHGPRELHIVLLPAQ